MSAPLNEPLKAVSKKEPFHVAIIKYHMKRKGVSYRRLAERLGSGGPAISPEALRNKINRGTFSAEFLIACMKMLSVRELDLQIF